MNDLSVWWHIGFVAAIAIALFAFGSQPTHDLGFLFQITPDANADGVPWQNIVPFGIAGAFALSLLQSQWTYTGYDASAHVAEETVFARRASAWGVFLSVAVSAVVGYIVLVALTLKMTSPADVLANSGGRRRRPVHPRIEPRRRPRPLGGLLSAGVAFAMTFCGFSSIASAGRMLFAFSRDDGIPGSGWLKRVSKRWRTPSNAVIAISTASWLLILLVYVLTKILGGDPLFLIGGITSVSTVLLYWAYGVCIWLGMRGDQSWRERQTWSLGRWSRPLAWLSVIWIILFSPVFLYPFALNPASRSWAPSWSCSRSTTSPWARRASRVPSARAREAELSEIEREFSQAAGRWHPDPRQPTQPQPRRAGRQRRPALPIQRRTARTPMSDQAATPSTPATKSSRRWSATAGSTPSSWPSPTCRAGSWASASRPRPSWTASSTTAPTSVPISWAPTWR